MQKAFTFEYLAGHLIDYPITKVKLLLEVDPQGLELSWVHAMVVGLPIEVQEEIDRDEVNTVEKLFNVLRKFEVKRRKETFYLVICLLIQL